jgi:hypothetical protein
MTMYRCYFLGGDSKIKSAEVIECATDADALEAAKQKIATSDYPTIEVWNRARRVGIVDRSEADGRFEAPANGAAANGAAANETLDESLVAGDRRNRGTTQTQPRSRAAARESGCPKPPDLAGVAD